jgi:hypothetical protein
MTLFWEFASSVESERKAILDSMGSSSESFGAIQSKLSQLESQLVTAVTDLRTKAIAIYDALFEQLQPEADRRFQLHPTFGARFRITCLGVWRSKSAALTDSTS